MHQDWKVITFEPKKKQDHKQTCSQLPSKKEFRLINKDFPLKLQQARTASGLTQKILSNKLNIDVTDLNSWERGLRLPNNDIIALLSKELKVKLPRNTKVLKESE
tara:strand:- start:757 stop:1071 length:315 start_codon:yes stop_codon:yes gene_type:complete